MKILPSILMVSLLFSSGCQSYYDSLNGYTTAELQASYFQGTFSASIDSIPSGADVYAIEPDGHLGSKIGTTPFTYSWPVTCQYRDFKNRSNPVY
jgi:hypothetical protein